MKANKDFKSHINYFKRSDSLKYIGIVLAVLGVFLYMFGWSYISYIIATIALPIGGALFIIGSSGRASDGDINEYITKRTEGIEIDLENNPSIKKRLLKQIPVETVEGYEYRDGLMVTKAKDGSIRSSEYTKSVLYSLSDALHIVSRRISIVSDETTPTEMAFSATASAIVSFTYCSSCSESISRLSARIILPLPEVMN